MSELLVRSLAAIVMAVVALFAAFLGGYIFAILIAIAAGAMFVEWRRLTESWGGGVSITSTPGIGTTVRVTLRIGERSGKPTVNGER